jgi:signal transduction histidine kinase
MNRDVDGQHALSFASSRSSSMTASPLSLVALETQCFRRSSMTAHIEMVDAIACVAERRVHDRFGTTWSTRVRSMWVVSRVHRAPTDVRALLESVVMRMTTARDRGRIVLDASPRLVLHVDALRIERVVANLVQNALKYSTTNVVVRLDLSGLVARVSVIDGGPGVARDDVEHLFEEYRRGSGAHLYDSSGLGLYVSKRIVEAHGGRIGVATTSSSGSEFYFELPMS